MYSSANSATLGHLTREKIFHSDSNDTSSSTEFELVTDVVFSFPHTIPLHTY